MPRDTLVKSLLAIAFVIVPARAQSPLSAAALPLQAPARSKEPAPALSSPVAAARLWEVGYELAQQAELTGAQARQAMLLLTAARSLNAGVSPVEPLLIKLAQRHVEKDYSDEMLVWLGSYLSESADRAVVRDAIRYLLDRANLWEDRKKLLEGLVSTIGNRNAAIDSDLAMLLGLLAAEKADVQAAKFYLTQAYKSNKHNKLAFAKLVEIAPEEIGPAVYLEHLRLALRENPVDANTAVTFAQYAERLQLYDTASLAYQYCAELFRYLYPTEPLPPHVYLPWAISSYNARRGQHVTLQIAESVRGSGRFDILLEAIAGRAAAKVGNAEDAQRIFRQAEAKAQQLLQAGPGQSLPAGQGGATAVRELTPRQFAWFYCFADCNPQKALEWANRAYSIEPNAPSSAALLAYALAMNNQMEWARPLVESSEANQIIDLVRARMQLALGNKRDAVTTLRAAIAKDPSSLAAEQAKGMLQELQSPYVPPVDPNLLTTFLRDSLGKGFIPQFLPPDKRIQVQFSVRSGESAPGSGIEGVVTILNQGTEPLIVTQDGLFKGIIRIDADVSGDIQRKIPSLVSQTVHTELAVQPGRSLTIPVRLSTGELRKLLTTYPQASLDIEFVLYLDPVVGEDGSVRNRLADMKPVTATMKRPGVELVATYIRNRYNSISSGQPGQKIATAQLFTSLLKEQYVMADQGALYPFRYAQWLPGLLRSSLTSDSGLLLGGGEDHWIVAVHTMADMLEMPLDGELISAAGRNLHHPKWPVRLMAMYLLAGESGDDFQNVLDWFAQNDSSDLVRSMAATLKSGRPVVATGPNPAGL